MIRTIRSQGLGVNTIFSPLSVVLALVPQGNSSLRQWYYRTNTGGVWSPSHAVSPVRLKPVVTVHDPETDESYSPTLASVVWRVIGLSHTEHTEPDPLDPSSTIKVYYDDYVANDTSEDYSVSADGTITVRKDISFDDPETLLCMVRYQGLTGEDGYIQESADLVTDVTSDPAYSIQVMGASNGKSFGNKLWWNPFSGTTSRMTVTAGVDLGGDDVSDSVKYFWYYVDGSTEVPVDSASNPCLAYVSGQNTKTLLVDASYESEGIEFHVRIAEAWVDGQGTAHTASEATEPNVAGVYGMATMRWYIGNVTVEGYSDNGDACRQGMDSHTFKVRVKQNGIDVDESIADQYLEIEWKRSYTNSSGVVTTTSEGMGSSVIISDTRLRNNMYPVAITPEASLKGSYVMVCLPMAVVTSTSGKNPKDEGWLVKNGEVYTPTTDTTPQSGRTYYRHDASGTIDAVVTFADSGVEKLVVSK